MQRDTLIARIYEASCLPELWPKVLEEFGGTVGTPNVVLALRRSDEWVGSMLSPSMEVPTRQYFASDIPARTEIATRLIAANQAGFVRSDDVFSEEEWEVDPFRNEWARKWGFNRGIATAIHTASAETIVLHVQRMENEPSFDRKETAVLDSFRPHLARAAFLAARCRLERLRAAAEGLELIGLPAVIVDLDGHVLAANASIQSLADHVRWGAGDRVLLKDPRAQRIMTASLARLKSSSLETLGSFVSRTADERAAVCHLIPTVRQARDIFDGGSAVLVVTPVRKRAAPEVSLIQSLFDLTPSEASVAWGLAQGQSIGELAASRQTALSTVRAQVRAILAKTGTKRQSEVVAVVGQFELLQSRRRAPHGAAACLIRRLELDR